jgi:glycosyltransferase involved in cell wall biosynthesis
MFPIPTSMKLSILIPVFNEARTIKQVLEKVYRVELIRDVQKEIIVINDCSFDNTDAEINTFLLDNPGSGITYISHPKNLGKGAALKSGMDYVTGDFVIIQDADLELDPEEINNLLKPVFNNGADVVFGSRFAGGQAPRSILSFWHNFANRVLTGFSNFMSNMNLTDMATCYKLIRTGSLRQMEICEKRFGIDAELTAKLSRMKDLKIFEIGISYYPRSRDEGKKIGWKDGIHMLYCIVKYNLF